MIITRYTRAHAPRPLLHTSRITIAQSRLQSTEDDILFVILRQYQWGIMESGGILINSIRFNSFKLIVLLHGRYISIICRRVSAVRTETRVNNSQSHLMRLKLHCPPSVLLYDIESCRQIGHMFFSQMIQWKGYWLSKYIIIICSISRLYFWLLQGTISLHFWNSEGNRFQLYIINHSIRRYNEIVYNIANL